jgi:ABC-2 type transport system ATP-binding protein
VAHAAAIEVRDLVKEFDGRRVVDGVSFSVPAGQVCALLGPNGAGKTTTIHMLLGLTLPTEGTVHVLGHDVATDRTAALARTGFTATYTSLPARLTVREILRVYAELYQVPDPRAAIEEIIGALNLQDLVKAGSRGLSSGQQTMVGLAKALLHRPDLLFLDEPTASLDPENAVEVRLLLRRIASERGMTVFITSHNMTEIDRMADRVLFVSRGRIVADDTPAQLRQRFAADDLEEVFLAVARESRAS